MFPHVFIFRQDLLSRAPEPPARWQCGLPLPAFFLALLSPCALARDGGLGATGSLGQWALRPFPCEAIGQPQLSDAPCFRTLPFFGYFTLVRFSRGRLCLCFCSPYAVFFRPLKHVLPSCATLGTPQRWILIGRLSYMLVLKWSRSSGEVFVCLIFACCFPLFSGCFSRHSWAARRGARMFVKKKKKIAVFR